MDWNDLINKTAQAARNAFDDLKKNRAGENFYAYALYTDSSAMTIVSAANSLEALENIVASDGDRSPESISYYKWSTSEWAYEAWKREEFRGISTALRESSDRDSDFAGFKRTVFNSMIEAMRKLSEDGFFGTEEERNSVTIFITSTDDDESQNIENESAKILNSEPVFKLFLSRS